VRDIPKAGFWARGTLIVTGLLVLFLNTGVIGAEATGVSAEPLLDGFRAIVGDQLAALLALFALVGLLALAAGHHVRLRAQHVLALRAPATTRASCR
jgi:ethanolamine permease